MAREVHVVRREHQSVNKVEGGFQVQDRFSNAGPQVQKIHPLHNSRLRSIFSIWLAKWKGRPREVAK